MGEDGFLDTSGEAGLTRINPLLVLLFSSMLLFACARIIVLNDPLTPEEHINLAVAYERKGRLDEAIKHYECAAKELPVAHYYLGNAYFLKNKPKEAGRHYRKAIKKDPRNADAMNNLAWLYYTEGKNLHKAEKLAEGALALNPSKSEIYMDTLNKIRALIESDISRSDD